jgi:hypothetical protein
MLRQTVSRPVCLGIKLPESESYVTTYGQSATLFSNKALFWGLRRGFYYCQTVVGFLMWGAFSDKGTGQCFKIAAGPRQRSNSRGRVPWDLLPYFTLSDSRLPFTSPPMTHMATVEILDPDSTQETSLTRLSLMLRPTVSRRVCLGIKHPSGAYNQIFITVRQLQVCWCGGLFLTRGRVCRLQLLLALANAVILRSEYRGTRDHILLSQIQDFPFRHLLRFAGLRWRYSTPPPHRRPRLSDDRGFMNMLGLLRLHRKHSVQEFLYSCVFIRCRWNVFTAPLPNNYRISFLHYSGFQAVVSQYVGPFYTIV